MSAVSGKLSFNFDDADIYAVMQTILGEGLKVNYMIDPRVKGRITFRSVAPVDKIDLLPLMEGVLRANGVGIVEHGGLYRVLPIADASKESLPMSSGRDAGDIEITGKVRFHAIPILNMQSSEFIRVVTPFLPPSAVLVDVAKNNQVVITDTDTTVRRVLQLVDMFDTEPTRKTSVPRIFVHHVKNARAKEVAAMLQQLLPGSKAASVSQPRATQASTSPKPAAPEAFVSDIAKILPDDSLNALLISATPEDYEMIKQTIGEIDVPPRQVVVEGMIAEVLLTDNLSLGLSWSLTATSNGNKGVISLNPTPLNLANPAKPVGSGFTFIGIDKDGVVRALITALATASKAKLLAAPHILVVDNKEAKIQVGSQVPIVTSFTYGAVGVAPQQTVQYRDTGIILRVKPRINHGGLVSLDLIQEISTFHTEELFNDQKEIIIDKTEAATNLVVNDGQTIVIGGLIREDTNRTKTGIPFLNQIPILGYLFGNSSVQTNRSEIIILLTPHVIRDETEARGMTSDYIDKYTGINKGGITKEQLIKNRDK